MIRIAHQVIGEVRSKPRKPKLIPAESSIDDSTNETVNASR